MYKGFSILDADCHVIEPFEMWEKYIEPAFKSRAPYCDETGIKVEGEPIWNKVSKEVQTEGARQVIRNNGMAVVRGFDPESYIKTMQKMGVDMAFLYPTVGLWMLAVDTMDAKLAGALTRAYNSWLRDFCSYDPQRLWGIGAINQHAPEEMVPELHRLAGFGWKAVFLRPNLVKGRSLSDPAYEPFWSECDRMGVAVCIHEGSHCRLPSAGADRFDTRFALHACSHPIEQMMGLLALIEGGVLERHPGLRVGFFEAGCGWLPYWLWRLDREWEDLAWEVRDNVKMKPSEYFQRQCFISVDPNEPYLEEVIRHTGTDNLLFGSDYPHMDSQPDIVERAVALADRLGESTVRKLLWDNPKRFFNLC